MKPLGYESYSILVAVDGSNSSLVAAGFAAQIARALGAHLGIVHVLDAPMRGFWAGIEDRIQHDIRAQAETTLRGVADKIADACELTPEFIIVEGILEEEILKLVEARGNVLMVVIGTQGLATERKSQLRLRSGAGKLADTLPVPLMLVPPNVNVAHLCSAMAEYLGDPVK